MGGELSPIRQREHEKLRRPTDKRKNKIAKELGKRRGSEFKAYWVLQFQRSISSRKARRC